MATNDPADSDTSAGEIVINYDRFLELTKTRDKLAAVVGLVQRFLQPAGSPPPGDEAVLVSWIVRERSKELDKFNEQQHYLLEKATRWENRAILLSRRIGELEAEVATIRTDRNNMLVGTNDCKSKVQYLINMMDLPEGTFTFPDGDTWRKENV